MFLLYLIWGLVVGLMVGLTSIGTGLLGTPGLMLLFGMPELAAVATMSFCGIFMMTAGAVGHVRHRHITWRVAGGFGATALPTSFLAASYADSVAEYIDFKVVMGVVIVLAVAAMAFRLYTDRQESEPYQPAAWRIALAPVVGVLSGFLVGATSISGSIIVLSLLFVLRIPERLAVGTTVLISAVALLFGALGHGLEGRLEWTVVEGLLPGVVVGAVVGSRLVKKLPVKALRMIMMVLLAMAGTWILIEGLYG